ATARVLHGSHYEVHVVAQDETPVRFLHFRSRVCFRSEPVLGRIITRQLLERRPGLQPDQPAAFAFHQKETLVRGAIQSIAAAKQRSNALFATSWALDARGHSRSSGFACIRASSIRRSARRDRAAVTGFLRESQIACSVNCLSGI